MALPGEDKRIRDFTVERRWTIFRIYRDRAKLFLKLSAAVGVIVTLTWLFVIETPAGARRDLTCYAWASWLDWQRVESPLEMSLGGQKWRGTASAFCEAYRTLEFGGRTFVELLTNALVAGSAATLAMFAMLSAIAWRRRPIESDDEIFKGDGMVAPSAFQREIYRGARTPDERPRPRLPSGGRDRL